MLRWSLTCLILALSALFVGCGDGTVVLGEVARMLFIGLMVALVLTLVLDLATSRTSRWPRGK